MLNRFAIVLNRFAIMLNRFAIISEYICHHIEVKKQSLSPLILTIMKGESDCFFCVFRGRVSP